MRKHLIAGLVAGLGLVGSSAHAETIYGLTNLQQLVTFDSNTRAVTSTTSLPSFSLAGEFLRDIDFRPATGQLYGLSSTDQLYVINPTTGAATAVGSAQAGLTGNVRSIDFNPVPDRVRLVTTGDNNLRINPNDGVALVDGTLAFAAGDTNAGDDPAVVAAGYTNSFAGAASTTLYVIDANNNALLTQNPPNNGTLNTVGSLGFDIVDSGGFTGFDISGSTGTAYLVGNALFGTNPLTVNTLYTVDLTTGAATSLGAVSGINGSFRSIAVQVVPEPTALAALAGAGTLVLRRKRAK